MIILTRKVDCPKGAKDSTTRLGGFIRSSNTRVFMGGISQTLGIPETELSIDYAAATVSWNGALVATMIATGNPAPE